MVNTLFYPDRIRVSIDCGDELITKQEFKDECDINNILKVYKKTGVIEHINQQQPVFTDLPDDIDYHSSLQSVLSAQTAFDSLPSVVRRYFDQDPARLLAALNDPSMHDQMVEFGIIKPKSGEPAPPGNPANNKPLATGNPTISPSGEATLP